MKSKTLIGLAVASTFGLSAAAYAGNGHEVMTPSSPNEAGQTMASIGQGFGSDQHLSSFGSTSTHAGGTVSGSSDFGSDHSASLGDSSMSGMDDALALGDEGIYSDYYIVSWTPMTSDGWDYYLIDTGSDEFASAEEVYILTPVYDVVVLEDLSSDFSSDLGE